METKKLRGGALAAKIREEVRQEADTLEVRGIRPRMAALCVGSDPAILNYLAAKSRSAEKCGILLETVALPDRTSQAELNDKIKKLAAEKSIHGVLLELPLPKGLDTDQVITLIPPAKDVDGLTPFNLGLALAGREENALVSATAQACVILAETEATLSGKNVAVVGKGRTVGKPLIPLLLNRGATVTVCHSKTPDLRLAIASAEVVFSGVGKAGILNSRVIREGQIIIDAGTIMDGGKLVGDASLDIWGVAGAATPVPEGIGPLTTALIFKNLVKAIKLQGL